MWRALNPVNISGRKETVVVVWCLYFIARIHALALSTEPLDLQSIRSPRKFKIQYFKQDFLGGDSINARSAYPHDQIGLLSGISHDRVSRTGRQWQPACERCSRRSSTCTSEDGCTETWRHALMHYICVHYLDFWCFCITWGRLWLKYLRQNKIPFYICTRNNCCKLVRGV